MAILKRSVKRQGTWQKTSRPPLFGETGVWETKTGGAAGEAAVTGSG
jgi:hypothetical protein